MNNAESVDSGLDDTALSPKEQAMWLLDAFTDLGVANIPAAYRLGRPLRAELLQQTVDRLVARHPGLRSTFPSEDGNPVRRILAVDDPAARCLVRRIEVDAASLGTELTTFTQPTFDLETEIPIRVGHLVGDPAGEVLCLVIQHLSCDAESFGVLIRELSRLYQAAERGEPVPAELTGEVPAYVEPRATEEDIDYWRRHLDGADGSSRVLDVGRAGAQRTSYDAGQVVVPLSDAAVAGVRTLCGELGMTSSIVIFTVFGALLSMSGAGEDMVLGVPIGARERSSRDAVGYHVNMLAVRVPMPGTSAFRDVARAARENYLAGLVHARASLDEVLPGSYEVSGHYRNPLFRHMFNYRSLRGFEDDGLVADRVEASNDYTWLDLQVTVLEGADGIDVSAVYSEELFDRADIVALLDRMDLLIRVCSEMPDMGLADLAVLAAPADRAPAEQPANPAAEDAALAKEPVSAAEQELFDLLVGLWRDVLRSPELDADAHFFRTGGTSLQAAQLVAKVKSKTGVKLSLRQVFKAPTPRLLAHQMGGAQ